jgi:hypothetical protein
MARTLSSHKFAQQPLGNRVRDGVFLVGIVARVRQPLDPASIGRSLLAFAIDPWRDHDALTRLVDEMSEAQALDNPSSIVGRRPIS